MRKRCKACEHFENKDKIYQCNHGDDLRILPAYVVDSNGAPYWCPRNGWDKEKEEKLDIRYFEDVDILDIDICGRKTSEYDHSIETDRIIVDVDKDGKFLGIEIHHVKKRIEENGRICRCKDKEVLDEKNSKEIDSHDDIKQRKSNPP